MNMWEHPQAEVQRLEPQHSEVFSLEPHLLK